MITFTNGVPESDRGDGGYVTGRRSVIDLLPAEERERPVADAERGAERIYTVLGFGGRWWGDRYAQTAWVSSVLEAHRFMYERNAIEFAKRSGGTVVTFVREGSEYAQVLQKLGVDGAEHSLQSVLVWAREVLLSRIRELETSLAFGDAFRLAELEQLADKLDIDLGGDDELR